MYFGVEAECCVTAVTLNVVIRPGHLISRTGSTWNVKISLQTKRYPSSRGLMSIQITFLVPPRAHVSCTQRLGQSRASFWLQPRFRLCTLVAKSGRQGGVALWWQQIRDSRPVTGASLARGKLVSEKVSKIYILEKSSSAQPSLVGTPPGMYCSM